MEEKNIWSKAAAFFLAVGALFAGAEARGSGFAVYTHNASALGQGNAVVAHADGPSAVYYNPALMGRLEGTQAEVGTTLIHPSREFRSAATGTNFEAETDVFFPSTFFFTHQFNNRVSGGLGVFNPFGLTTDWGGRWEGRYITTKSELHTFNINPAVSFRVLPAVSVAAGVDFLLLDAELEKKINLSSFGLPDGAQKFEGDGDGVGYNVGIAVTPHEDVTIGAAFRSEVHMDIDGDARFDVHPTISALFPDTGGDTELDLPAQAFAGVYYRGFYPFTFETGVRWEGWSSFDELRVNLDRPVAGSTTNITPRDWHDTYAVNLGMKYYLSEAVALHAGYLYSENPVPDKTFEPSIPDSDAHVFSVGTALDYRKLQLQLAYAYQLLEKRTKDNLIDDNPSDALNPAFSANGDYETDIHMFAVSLLWRF